MDTGVRKPPNTTLAWLAALIDGEGTVLCTKHRTAASLREGRNGQNYTEEQRVAVDALAAHISRLNRKGRQHATG